MLLGMLLLLRLDDFADGGATDGAPDRGVIKSFLKSSFVRAGMLQVRKIKFTSAIQMLKLPNDLLILSIELDCG